MGDKQFDILLKEIVLTTSRSSGPGGQAANKLETKVILQWNVFDSEVFSNDEKTIILQKLKNQISKKGYLTLTHQTERSQLANKEKIILKFKDLIEKALAKPKKRKKTSPTKESKEARIKRKSMRSAIKKMRAKPKLDD